MEDTSVSLLERIAERNLSEDWERLLSIYSPFIDSQVRRYPPLASHADDVVQEISMVLVRELPSFQRQRTGSFRKWFRQVVVNQLRVALRKANSRTQPVGNLPEFESDLDQLSDPHSLASQQWEMLHDREVLRKIVEIVQRESNPTHWQAFQMHVLEERPVAEVAEILGVTPNVVNLAKSRIRRRMEVEAAGLIGD